MIGIANPSFEQFIRAILAMRSAPLPESAIVRAKHILADLAGCAWLGGQTSELGQLAGRIGQAEQTAVAVVPLLGQSRFAAPESSALYHGTATVALEMEEGNALAKGHPGAHVFPAAWAAAVQAGSSGEAFIRAFVLGYEAAARLAYAAQLKPGFHAHGTWGAVGGCLAAGLLYESPDEDIVGAALLAASLPLASASAANGTGASVRNLYAGWSGWSSLQAFQLFRDGFRSHPDVVHQVWNGLIAERLEEGRLLDRLAAPLLVERNYFKLYPSCRFAHAPIEALQQLLHTHRWQPDEVAEVFVETHRLAMDMKTAAPPNPLAAMFSIPFLLALTAWGYGPYLQEDDPLLRDSRLLDWAGRVQVSEDLQLTAQLPSVRAARVRVRLRSGEAYEALVEFPSGGEERPLDTERLLDKFSRWPARESSGELDRLLADALQLEKFEYVVNWAVGPHQYI
ncbi:MmgE/PrpD family protein [Paenibacillus filicis]|uniref:MmgE/PrpD family protein n=1 Tax=Paenibacillus filicis TaxID=669464 RepID=A0ABU9DQY3_9BACL